MEFLADLDEYFCETFAGYELFCGLPQYNMPKMQETKIDEYGRKISYTLPKTTLRLANQENKAELLAIVKGKLSTLDFSFSFHPTPLAYVFKHRFSKKGLVKTLNRIARQHNGTIEGLFDGVEIDADVIKRIKRAEVYPMKNMLFSIALTAQLSVQETDDLMQVCEMEWEYSFQRDVVVRYLLEQKIYNQELIQTALKEYNVKHLYIKSNV